MTLPFVMPDPFSSNSSKRVLAHYFYPFPMSLDNAPAATDYYNRNYLSINGEGGKHAAYGGYLRQRPMPVPVGGLTAYQLANMQTEVSDAIARGITGFAIDLLSLSDALDTQGSLTRLFEAAQAVDPRFWVMPMLDMSSMSTLTQDQAVQILTYCAKFPNVSRIADGRLLFSAYMASKQNLAWWTGVIASLNKANINVAFIPIELGSPISTPFDPIAIGTGNWGTAIPSVAKGPAAYMQPILTQQFRPKSTSFWECVGFDTFRNYWESAIRDGSQYCQIITWSDYSESGQVQPYTDATLASNIGTAFYDLAAYYGAWFVSGEAPVITKDVLYWNYRIMTSKAAHPNQTDNFTVQSSQPEVSNIECLAFLTEPGTVLINGTSFAAPAGISSFKVPVAAGQPKMTLQRNGSNVFQGTCPLTIYGSGGSPAGTLDLTYWGGSISA